MAPATDQMNRRKFSRVGGSQDKFSEKEEESEASQAKGDERFHGFGDLRVAQLVWGKKGFVGAEGGRT